VLILCLYFFLAGLAFLGNIGTEDDETIFAMPFLKPASWTSAIRIGHSRIPLMIMSYIGSLKSWLYRPILSIFGTGTVAIRVPVLLAGVGSIWLFFLLLRRMAGLRAALIGCAILATDATYLLTTVFDWGPVALQHLLLLAGFLGLARFYQERSHRALFWGFFFLGMALWDKALAIWMLSGAGVAALVVFGRQMLALFTRRRMAIAALGFVLGALPLLIYNAKNHWTTFAGNFHKDTSDLPGKARMLMNTAKGGGLFGWMFDENWQTPQPHAPRGIDQRLSANISSLAGHPREHLLFYAFLLAVLLIPLARGDAVRLIIAAILAMAIAWIQMAVNANTGGSVHHTILLWPLPQMVVAVSFAAASRRLGRAGIAVLAAAGLAMTVTGAAVGAEYHYVSYTYGGSPGWTDAIFPLTGYMKGLPYKHIYCIDWGMLDSLRLLSHGTLPGLLVGDDPVSHAQLTEDERATVLREVADPDGVFIAHTKDYENFKGVNEKLLKFAGENGYAREMLRVIPDSYGRPAYEVYRLVRGGE
jgi:4-amino-4-deoxy-L-arabinose transferase-like glycosyltransferase